MAKLKYKTIDIKSTRELGQAEALKRKGWKIASIGFTTIQFYKENKK